MNERPISRRQLLESLPDPWPHELLGRIRAAVARSGRKIVVLDDDPTGTQTVHAVCVLTEWTVEAFESLLRDEASCAYVLTNSRSLPADEAVALNRQLGANLLAASKTTGQDFIVISRSDSTLRGHFPAETDALAQALGLRYDACLLVPFFAEGNRLTVNDVHYVTEGDRLVPASQTPFAGDSAFGYTRSNLREWAEEKTAGRVRADQVASISIETIRSGGPEAVADVLRGLEDGRICVVNAACPRDVEVVSLALLQAEAEGKRFLYRTAASIVPARCGMRPRGLLGLEELEISDGPGGLVVFGSYVPKSSQQLRHLLEHVPIQAVEVSAEKLLSPSRKAEIDRVSRAAGAAIGAGEDVVVYTSRKLIAGSDRQGNLKIAREVSCGLVSIVRGVSARPRYLLTKGGITSSDIAVHACAARRATVLGQILPGVPVWRLGGQSRHPGLPLIVFPGNVGEIDAVSRVVRQLRR